MTEFTQADSIGFVNGKAVAVTYRGKERYLDAEDQRKVWETLGPFNLEDACDGFADRIKESDFLLALETLRTHLRKKYYAG